MFYLSSPDLICKQRILSAFRLRFLRGRFADKLRGGGRLDDQHEHFPQIAGAASARQPAAGLPDASFYFINFVAGFSCTHLLNLVSVDSSPGNRRLKYLP